jgi:hypothetical protein
MILFAKENFELDLLFKKKTKKNFKLLIQIDLCSTKNTSET